MIFDGHSDICTDIVQRRLKGEKDIIKRRHLDKFNKGGITGSIFVMWVDPPYTDNPKKRIMELIKTVSNEFNENRDIIKHIREFDDFEKAKKDGKLAIVLGMEGLSPIEDDIELIDALYNFGVRHASVTWNEKNKLGAGAPQSNDYGLTEEGAKVVKRMEELGIVVDVSHSNEKTFWDICEVVTKPIIASHSNCRALCDVKRNLTDDQLRAVAKTGGLVGLNSYREFIDENVDKQDLEHLINHLDHMIEVIGIDHVGFGFDFLDFIEEEEIGNHMEIGDNSNTRGLENATKVKNLIELLEKRGYSKEYIEKISYKNFYRVMKECFRD